MDEFICQTVCNNCTGTASLNNLSSLEECQQRLQKLPLLSADGYADGMDYSCRVLHSTFVPANPFHCNHLSFVPAEDPSGAIKCQSSAKLPISVLFSSADLKSRANFSESIDILPEKGFSIVCEDSEEHKPSFKRTAPGYRLILILGANWMALFLHVLRPATRIVFDRNLFSVLIHSALRKALRGNTYNLLF